MTKIMYTVTNKCVIVDELTGILTYHSGLLHVYFVKAVEKMKKRILTVFLAVAFLSGGISTFADNAVSDSFPDNERTAAKIAEYQSFLTDNANVERPDNTIELNASNLTACSSEAFVDRIDSADVVSLPAGSGFIEYSANLAQEGMYCLQIVYYNLPLKQADIEFSLLINAKLPYRLAGELLLQRLYKNKGAIKTDARGNEIRPEKEEVNGFQTAYITDRQRIYETLWFLFDEGENTVRLEFARGGIAVEKISLTPYTPAVGYAEYYAGVSHSADHVPSDYNAFIQGENASLVSSTVLYPTYDKMDVMTQSGDGTPNSPSKLKINTIGQSTFKTPGQTIEWEVDAPYDGFYNIGLRARQNIVVGFYSSRRIYIDGEILFNEMNDVQFPYTYGWDIKLIGDNTPYKIYLSKGSHRLKMEVTAGAAGEILSEFEEIVYDLNTIYREIIVITGINPDPNRDYNLYDEVYDLNGRLANLSERLGKAAENLKKAGIMSGNNAVAARTLVIQLNDFIKTPTSIAMRIRRFRDNISSLSGWLLSLSDQPLEIDYMFLKSPSAPEPAKSGGFFRQMSFRFRSFLCSFSEDYTLFDNSGNSPEAISVWVGTGRDQAQIIKDMADNEFSPKSGISVNISLVQQGIIEAVASGRAPDVLLYTDMQTPVNLAARQTVEDLSGYDGFERIRERFNPELFTSFRYKDGIYALPLEETFLMVFYRKDIFEQMALSPPETWEDFYTVTGKLQKKNFMVGVPVGTSAQPDDSMFKTLLFQNGGSLFNEDYTKTNLNQESSLKAFKQWTDLFVKYRFEQSYDFFNRFRNGEMPMAIQPYSVYNQLAVAAPELRGLWAMAPVPGTVRQDGSVDRTVVSNLSAAVIMSQSANKQNAFDFLEWFTDGNPQAEYGVTVENVLGPGGRYCPANREIGRAHV